MSKRLSKYLAKLYFKQWIIGMCQADIMEIIRNRSFNPDIKWFYLNSFDKFVADPFFVTSGDNNIKIIYEDYTFDDDYGKISLMTIGKGMSPVGEKSLLDTGSHLSYPFVFYENNKIYIIPEAARSGRLPCYEYDHADESLKFLTDLIELPLRDATVLKYNNKYWIFAIISENEADYRMHVFFSDTLLGPYSPHKNNPIKTGLNGTRSAGNFIEVDGIIYRPVQNCQNGYGESIMITRITELSEQSVTEEPYLSIKINTKNINNKGIHSIHTINQTDGVLVVDGEQWTFAPFSQLRKYLRSMTTAGKTASIK